MKKNTKRSGFTLVELLIVIVVIGVLSAMMMLSSTEAVSSAKAADIISDLRNLKTAALAWYADNLTTADGLASKGLNPKSSDILKYLSNENVDSKYKFYNDTANQWYVGFDAPDTKVGEKLKARASSVGLLKSQKSNDIYAGSGTVYMLVK